MSGEYFLNEHLNEQAQEELRKKAIHLYKGLVVYYDDAQGLIDEC